MTNAYYNHTDGVPASNSRGSSALVQSEFDLLAAGFALLPAPTAVGGSTQNYKVDSGTVNAVVVTAPTNIVAYADGQEIAFRALYTNTGAATINIGGIGSVALVRSDGTALQAGDYFINQIVEARYSSVDAAFMVMNMGPAAAATATAQAAAAAVSAAAALVSQLASAVSAAAADCAAAVGYAVFSASSTSEHR